MENYGQLEPLTEQQKKEIEEDKERDTRPETSPGYKILLFGYYGFLRVYEHSLNIYNGCKNMYSHPIWKQIWSEFKVLSGRIFRPTVKEEIKDETEKEKEANSKVIFCVSTS